jgi:5-methylcytosine-specific restriction endonuclease McrA
MNKRKGINHPPVQTKEAVIRRDDGLCLYRLDGCTGVAQTTDHRAGRGAGGSRVLNHPANLAGVCIICNGEKENATGEVLEDLIRRGLTILKSSTNEKTLTRAKETPVLYPDGKWYRLIDASTRLPVPSPH